jgi:hypothetical protein
MGAEGRGAGTSELEGKKSCDVEESGTRLRTSERGAESGHCTHCYYILELSWV